MLKNKSFIGIAFIVLVFGIIVVPKIVERVKLGNVVKGNDLDLIESNKKNSDLIVLGPAPQFELLNQDNQPISNQYFLGKVYVVEFFFTTCPSICPKMNKNMLDIEKNFFGNPNFAIASITINPENDTPAVLKTHAQKIGVVSKNWQFLTGKKEYIYGIANKGFNIFAGENINVNGGFEHSGLFALIDKKGQIRCRKDGYGNPIGYYDGLEKEGIKAIMQDINLLLEE